MLGFVKHAIVRYLNAVNSSSKASTRKVLKIFNRDRREVFPFTMFNHSPAIHFTEKNKVYRLRRDNHVAVRAIFIYLRWHN
jgi:hypothetical protein